MSIGILRCQGSLLWPMDYDQELIDLISDKAQAARHPDTYQCENMDLDSKS